MPDRSHIISSMSAHTLPNSDGIYICAVDLKPAQRFFKLDRRRRYAAIAINSKGTAIEHQFILPPYLVDINHREVVSLGPLRNHGLPLLGFTPMERRGI